MNQTQLKKYGLECLGTIVFISSILIFNNAWMIGLVLAIVIYIAGPITGGHFNPAVTITMYAKKAIKMNDAIFYIISQVVGGLIALVLYNMMDM